jgi:hypothetical protein
MRPSNQLTASLAVSFRLRGRLPHWEGRGHLVLGPVDKQSSSWVSVENAFGVLGLGINKDCKRSGELACGESHETGRTFEPRELKYLKNGQEKAGC